MGFVQDMGVWRCEECGVVIRKDPRYIDDDMICKNCYEESLFDSKQSYNNYIKCREAAQVVNNLLSEDKIVISDTGEVLSKGFTYEDNEGKLAIGLDSIIYIGWEWDENDRIYVSDEATEDFINIIKKFKVASKFERVKL